jgi:hypothetical protein
MNYVHHFISSYLTLLPPDQKQSLQDSWYQYISTARFNKGNKLLSTNNEEKSMEMNKTDKETSLKESYDHFPFPVIILGYNHGFIINNLNSNLPNDVLAIHRFKENVGKLRYYCFHLGAALIFTPTMNELPNLTYNPNNNNNNNTNTNKQKAENLLRKYLLHRFYPEQVAMDLFIEVSSTLKLYFFFLSGFTFRLFCFRKNWINYSFPVDLIR